MILLFPHCKHFRTEAVKLLPRAGIFPQKADQVVSLRQAVPIEASRTRPAARYGQFRADFRRYPGGTASYRESSRPRPDPQESLPYWSRAQYSRSPPSLTTGKNRTGSCQPAVPTSSPGSSSRLFLLCSAPLPAPPCPRRTPHRCAKTSLCHCGSRTPSDLLRGKLFSTLLSKS